MGLALLELFLEPISIDDFPWRGRVTAETQRIDILIANVHRQDILIENKL
ncbi:hypothetical protein MHM84_20285 [Halomonas sp. McH1-25]|nr:hypothetical protein [Halomonas sp. BBD45]MCG7602084.1 hypothetical protein [Halomonas sp. McH1-25]MCP1362544.1 hypothetical protein [Halomonas sp. BBD45]MCP1364196.1 hypothetical protein [Halomonas sp. BBD48]